MSHRFGLPGVAVAAARDRERSVWPDRDREPDRDAERLWSCTAAGDLVEIRSVRVVHLVRVNAKQDAVSVRKDDGAVDEWALEP
jgi:hypothetical protein